MTTLPRRFRHFSALTLGFTLLVILWGAFVRASGSGAGCGSHWPTCNGEVLPPAENIKTVIEFTHRVTSGLCFFLVFAQMIWTRLRLPKGDRVRRAAGVGFIFIVTEALVGAGLVLFEMVAENKSIGRAYWMAGHLINTFVLVAALALTWWWSSGEERTELEGSAGRLRSAARALSVGAIGIVLVATSGAIAALGDTLFPVTSLQAGLAQDLSPTAHAFLKLRVWHPVLAMLTAVYLLAWLAGLAARPEIRAARVRMLTAAGLVVVQVVAGFVNLFLLAPIAMQIVHLLLADMVWMAVVIVVAELRGAAARGVVEVEAVATAV